MFFFFFFNATAPTEIYTLSLHDALPIWSALLRDALRLLALARLHRLLHVRQPIVRRRSEEHTSELQSHSDLVCRLLLEKKKQIKMHAPTERHYDHNSPHNILSHSDTPHT